MLFDGSIRNDRDVFKELALRADPVLIGRPVLWGLAYGGQYGVVTVVNILERELSSTIAIGRSRRCERYW